MHESRLLGDPGPFVIDSKAVSDQLEGLDDQGTMDFFREHPWNSQTRHGILGGRFVGVARELVESHTEGLVSLSRMMLSFQPSLLFSAFTTMNGRNRFTWSCHQIRYER